MLSISLNITHPHSYTPHYTSYTPHTRTRYPLKRTQWPYTPRSRTYRHWQYHWQSHHIVCVIVTPVLQSAHELCEICDNPFRVPHATHNKIKHLRECKSWHVFCNVKRHDATHHKGAKHATTTHSWQHHVNGIRHDGLCTWIRAFVLHRMGRVHAPYPHVRVQPKEAWTR